MVLQNINLVKIFGSTSDVVCARAGGANTTQYSSSVVHFAKQKIIISFLFQQNMKSGGEKIIWRNPNPARIPPQTPPAGWKSAEAKRKILFPRKTDFRFAESVLKPHALPEYLEGRTPKKNVLSIFKKKFTPAKSKKQETFFFGVAGVLASAWGFLRAYDLVSSHHARGACEVITSLCFGNRCEFGTIETPIRNSKVFLKQKCGTREARPKDSHRIPPTNSEFLARKRALFFRQEAGASQRFLWHRPFSQKGLNQKQFCPRIERLLASFGKVRANHSACVKERSFLLGATSSPTTILFFVRYSPLG